MSDASEKALSAPTTDSMAAFSGQLDELTDALGLLYIRNNASGRNKFRSKWPEVALFLFEEQLIKYDNEGTQDREHRSELEFSAGERRIQIKQTIVDIIEKSVDKGSLMFDFVGEVIDLYGAGISRFLYAEDVIERVRPGLLAQFATDQKEAEKKTVAKVRVQDDMAKSVDNFKDAPIEESDAQPSSAEDQKLSAEEQSILSNTSEEKDEKPPVDTLDDVKPIDATSPLPPPRTLHNPVSETLQMSEEKPADSEQPAEVDIPETSVIEVVEAEKSSGVPAQEEVAQEVEMPLARGENIKVTPDTEAVPKQETPVERAEPAPAPEELPTPTMSEVLDSVKPIDAAPQPPSSPSPEPQIEASEQAVEEKVATVEVVKEPSVEDKKPIEDSAVVKEEVPPVEPDVVPPIIVEEPSKEESPEPVIETPKIDAVDDKPISESVERVEKGTYVALFNAIAQVV